MNDPERVIDNSYFFAHHWSLIFSRSSAGLACRAELKIATVFGIAGDYFFRPYQ
jgi:hypothetical protein